MVPCSLVMGPDALTPETLGAALLSRPGRAWPGRSRVIAVDGWSGSGKTSLAGRVAAAVGVPCVHLDDWVPGWSGLARSVELLVDWVLRPLAEGRPARWQRWDWNTGRFDPATQVLAPADVVIVEGCGAGSALARPWLSTVMWISLDEPQRRRRLRARPDWPIYAPWADMWAEQERALRAGEDPLAAADVIVETDSDPDRLVVRWNN